MDGKRVRAVRVASDDDVGDRRDGDGGGPYPSSGEYAARPGGGTVGLVVTDETSVKASPPRGDGERRHTALSLVRGREHENLAARPVRGFDDDGRVYLQAETWLSSGC